MIGTNAAPSFNNARAFWSQFASWQPKVALLLSYFVPVAVRFTFVWPLVDSNST